MRSEELTFIDRLILVSGGKVCHLLEKNHLEIQLVMVLVLAGSGMIAANYEMCRAEVFADESVPDRFAGTTHAHREWEEGKLRHTVGVALHDGFMYAGAAVKEALFVSMQNVGCGGGVTHV
jgi:hypothetical protein